MSLCVLLSLGFLLPSPSDTLANGSPKITAEEFEAQLGYQTGTISIKNGLATIHLPPTFRYLGPESSKRLLTEAWGNPAQAAENTLGMLIPTAASPLSAEGWGIIITYDEDGYVNDKGAATIDYDKLLKQLQEGTVQENKERAKQGYPSISVVGWAENPSYDSAAHKLYWAKEIAFGQDTVHTLNYNIRILGRRGVLVLNAVAGMNQLEAVHNEARSILGSVEFNEGHRYADYLPGKDKAAEYGIVGLIAGAVAVKAGLFKLIWVGILALKKFILLGLAALGAGIKKIMGRRKAAAEPPATPG